MSSPENQPKSLKRLAESASSDAALSDQPASASAGKLPADKGKTSAESEKQLSAERTKLEKVFKKMTEADSPEDLKEFILSKRVFSKFRDFLVKEGEIVAQASGTKIDVPAFLAKGQRIEEAKDTLLTRLTQGAHGFSAIEEVEKLRKMLFEQERPAEQTAALSDATINEASATAASSKPNKTVGASSQLNGGETEVKQALDAHSPRSGAEKSVTATTNIDEDSGSTPHDVRTRSESLPHQAVSRKEKPAARRDVERKEGGVKKTIAPPESPELKARRIKQEALTREADLSMQRLDTAVEKDLAYYKTHGRLPPVPHTSSQGLPLSPTYEQLRHYKNFGTWNPSPKTAPPRPPPRPLETPAAKTERSRAQEPERAISAVELLHRVLTDVERVPAGQTIPRRLLDGKIIGVSGREMGTGIRKLVASYQTLEFPKKSPKERRDIILLDIENLTSHPQLRADLEKTFAAKGWLPPAVEFAKTVAETKTAEPRPPVDTEPKKADAAPSPPKESTTSTPPSTPPPVAEKAEAPKPPEKAEAPPLRVGDLALHTTWKVPKKIISIQQIKGIPHAFTGSTLWTPLSELELATSAPTDAVKSAEAVPVAKSTETVLPTRATDTVPVPVAEKIQPPAFKVGDIATHTSWKSPKKIISIQQIKGIPHAFTGSTLWTPLSELEPATSAPTATVKPSEGAVTPVPKAPEVVSVPNPAEISPIKPPEVASTSAAKSESAPKGLTPEQTKLLTFENLATWSKEDLAKLAAAVPNDGVWAVALQSMTTSALEKVVQAALPPARVNNFALEILTMPIKTKPEIEAKQQVIMAEAQKMRADKAGSA